MTTYDDLVEAIAEWPDLRGEPELQAAIPTLIVLAEAAINNDMDLRLSEALTDSTGSASESIADLPADCLQVERVSVAGVPLDFVMIDKLRSSCSRNGSYAIDGMRLLFDRVQEEYTLRYYQRPPALKDAGTNWLIEKEPGLYIFGTLIQAAIFNKESVQETTRYETAYSNCITRLSNSDWQARLPAGQAM